MRDVGVEVEVDVAGFQRLNKFKQLQLTRMARVFDFIVARVTEKGVQDSGLNLVVGCMLGHEPRRHKMMLLVFFEVDLGAGLGDVLAGQHEDKRRILLPTPLLHHLLVHYLQRRRPLRVLLLRDQAEVLGEPEHFHLVVLVREAHDLGVEVFGELDEHLLFAEEVGVDEYLALGILLLPDCLDSLPHFFVALLLCRKRHLRRAKCIIQI